MAEEKYLQNKHKNTSMMILLIIIFFFVSACLFLHVSPFRLIGAAFCHQIPSRSPDFLFPFCYRCAGLFSGVFWGLAASLIWKKEKKLFPAKLICFFLFSLLLFITDILNSSKFPMIHLYPEQVNIRFLSAFPLGFFLSRIIMQIFRYWFHIKNFFQIHNAIIKIITFILFAAISYSLIFSHVKLLSVISEILLSIGCIVFLSILYTILVVCISLLRNKQPDKISVLIAGLTLALVHITCFGGVHIRFLHFEQLFS